MFIETENTSAFLDKKTACEVEYSTLQAVAMIM